jgi:hypothetical protein
MPGIKTIAIPPNPGARRGQRIAASSAASVQPAIAAEDGAILPPIARHPAPARTVLAQPSHRYRVGERLKMTNGGYSVARAGSFCKVMSLLPYEGHGALLYRVRSETEQFERVVAEADLSRNRDGVA